MGVTAEAADSDLLALEILRALDVGLAHDAVGQEVFHAADEDQIVGALHDGAHVADRAGDADLGVAAECGRCGNGRGGNKNQIEIEIVLLEQARFPGDPRHRLRHDLSRVKADEPVGGKERHGLNGQRRRAR